MERLDFLFCENDDNELLLDLEYSSNHKSDDIGIIQHYISKNDINIDYNIMDFLCRYSNPSV